MKRFLLVFGPGLLVAATGVGAGDLATSALAGAKVGPSILIAVVFGGVIKYILNEGLARWQFHSGTTLLEGAMRYYGRWARYLFLAYLLAWSFTVGVALMSASGIALHAILPLFKEPATGKVLFGAGLSVLGMVIVRAGGFRLFERLMSLAVVLMVITVIYTMFSLDLRIEWSALIRLPDPRHADWYLAVLGGVGGTVTILCYGYWIHEHGREGNSGLRISRIDLALAYGVTVLLGAGMVLIGSRIRLEGSGANLLVQLSTVLQNESGLLASWLFRVGAFAAIYSSLLGVWQSVPYLYTNLIELMRNPDRPSEVSVQSHWYRGCLYGLTFLPMLGMPFGFAGMQKLYALSGAVFIPLLAITLILLHFQSPERRRTFKNPVYMNILYGLILLLFVTLAIRSGGG